jgi:hypothetical protein
MGGYEFEDDAPLELTGTDELEEVSRTEISASERLTKVFEDDTKAKDERAARIHEKPEPLRLHKKAKKPRKFHDKDYITIRCMLCEMDYTHAKKDDEGNFIPFALCQHVVFKGATIEE